ncbi:MAG: hypothetical protein IPO98_15640 [Saprospiraceae bacterium]|jgi:hypothetical protein|nr:hypothetical protein [Saprospiraceae bacterium]
MKNCRFVLFLLSISISIASAQTDDQVKLDNLKYYLSVVKEYSTSMRYYTDSVKILSLLDQLDEVTTALDNEVNSIVIPEIEAVEEMADTVQEVTEEKIENLDNINMESHEPESDSGHEMDNNAGGFGLSKFMPFKKKFNTSFKIQFGVNSICQGTDPRSGILYPDINTSGSWFWDFSIIRKARLGGKNSHVSLIYGFSYLKNKLKIENDIRLTANSTDKPEFVLVPNLRSNPSINIGYLNVPVSLSFALSGKTKLDVGGYVGYRISTVQKIDLKSTKETIHEHRYGRYGLNNWIYGVNTSLDISGFDLIIRYNLSKLFKDSSIQDYNTWMVGTSITLF